VKLKWTRNTPTYWVADAHDATIKKWQHTASDRWFYTAFVTVKDIPWSAGALTLADAKNAAQVLADAMGKGE
jgi:hypothetical protein